MDQVNSKGAIVLFGASYLRNWKIDSLADTPVLNRAECGVQTFELLEMFPRRVVPERPRAVLIWGFNDLLRASHDAIDQALDRECANVGALVRAAKASRIEPILVTELMIGSPQTWLEAVRRVLGRLRGKQSYPAFINQRVWRLNAFLRRLAKQEGLLLIDLHPLFTEPDGRRRRAFTGRDGNHITAAGYAAIGAYVEPLVATHLRAGPMVASWHQPRNGRTVRPARAQDRGRVRENP